MAKKHSPRNMATANDSPSLRNTVVGCAITGIALAIIFHRVKPEETEPADSTQSLLADTRYDAPRDLPFPKLLTNYQSQANHTPATAMPEPVVPSGQELDAAVAAPDPVVTQQHSPVTEKTAKNIQTNIPPEESNSILLTYRIGNITVRLLPQVDAAFKKVSAETGFPIATMMVTCKYESNCDPEKTNPKSGACGLFQFMTDDKTQTLFRLLYNHGAQLGYPEQVNWVEPYETETTDPEELKKRKNGTHTYFHRPKTEEHRKKIISLCKDPEFSAEMFVVEKQRELKKFNRDHGFLPVIGQHPLINNLGLGGFVELRARIMSDDKARKTTMARDWDYFKARPKILIQNPWLARYPDKKYEETIIGEDGTKKTVTKIKRGANKTLRQAYDTIIAESGGWAKPETVEPILLSHNMQ